MNSSIWAHFEKIPGTTNSKCLLCRKEYSYKTSITNLKKHLRHKHLSTYENFLNTTINDCSCSDRAPNVTIVHEPASDNASDEERATGIESPPIIEKSYTKQEPRKKFKYERELAPSNEFYFVETGSESLDKEFDAIGANVACKLKRMSPKQRCHAELLINKVLIYGLQNNLTDDTDLTEVYKS